MEKQTDFVKRLQEMLVYQLEILERTNKDARNAFEEFRQSEEAHKEKRRRRDHSILLSTLRDTIESQPDATFRTKLQESVSIYGDINSSWYDDFGFGAANDWGFYGGAYVPPVFQYPKLQGEQIPVFRDEWQLRLLRWRSRAISFSNEFAQSGIRNRANYCVGTGYRYSVVPIDEESNEDFSEEQKYIDLICNVNDFPTLEYECSTREDIDGEWFLRLFCREDNLVNIRAVDPDFVRSPAGESVGPNAFGIQTDEDDIETVKGYWIVQNPYRNLQPDFVPESKVVHVKSNCYRNSKRGVPLYYPVESNLRRIEDLLATMTSQAQARGKIALIRKLEGSSRDAADSLVSALTEVTTVDPVTGFSRNFEKLPYGSILTSSKNIDYEFPSWTLGAADTVAAIQAEVRAIASMLCMTEWMFSALPDATYANAFVVESNTLRNFERRQRIFAQALGEGRIGQQKSVLWRCLEYAASRGVIDPEKLKRCKILATPPSLQTRDKEQEARVNQIYNQMGVKSIETIQEEQDLDSEREAKRLTSEKQRAGEAKQQPADTQSTEEALFESIKLREDRSGLVAKKITDKNGDIRTVYVRTGSESNEPEPHHDEVLLADAIASSGEHPTASSWKAIKQATKSAWSAVKTFVATSNLATLGHLVATEVLDDASDIGSIKYGTKTAFGTTEDSFLAATGIPIHHVAKIFAVVISKLQEQVGKLLGSKVQESQVDTKKLAQQLVETFEEAILGKQKLQEATKTGIDKLGRPYKTVDGVHVPVTSDKEKAKILKQHSEASKPTKDSAMLKGLEASTIGKTSTLEQRLAEENEDLIVKDLDRSGFKGLKNLTDNEAFDNVGLVKGVLHLMECKTMITNSTGNVKCNSYQKMRKNLYAKGIQLLTVGDASQRGIDVSKLETIPFVVDGIKREYVQIPVEGWKEGTQSRIHFVVVDHRDDYLKHVQKRGNLDKRKIEGSTYYQRGAKAWNRNDMILAATSEDLAALMKMSDYEFTKVAESFKGYTWSQNPKLRGQPHPEAPFVPKPSKEVQIYNELQARQEKLQSQRDRVANLQLRYERLTAKIATIEASQDIKKLSGQQLQNLYNKKKLFNAKMPVLVDSIYKGISRREAKLKLSQEAWKKLPEEAKIRAIGGSDGR